MEYIVYVKPNDSGYITAVNSSAFLDDVTGWVEIDRGYGDKYHHAQGNYFEKSIKTDGGAYRYRLVSGQDKKWRECTPEEIAEQEAANQPDTSIPTQDERIAALEEQNAALKDENTMLTAQVSALSDQMDFYEDCIVEMAEVVYA